MMKQLGGRGRAPRSSAGSSTLTTTKAERNMVKIRLRRMGAKKQPTYRFVVADARAPRDGRFIEILGHYNPRTEPQTVVVNEDEGQGVAREGRAALRDRAPALCRERAHGARTDSDDEAQAQDGARQQRRERVRRRVRPFQRNGRRRARAHDLRAQGTGAARNRHRDMSRHRATQLAPRPPRPARPSANARPRAVQPSDPWAGHRRATELLGFLARKLVQKPEASASSSSSTSRRSR